MNTPATCCAALAAAALASSATAQTICGEWQTAPALNGYVNAIAEFQGETYLGGTFLGAGGNCVTRWDGTSYVPLLHQLQQGQASALAVYDNGTGPALYAGGSSFDLPTQPSTRVYGVARWNGQSWTGTGFPSSSSVSELAVYDDGAGPALYALGNSNPALLRWSGGAWTSVSGAPSGMSLAVFDDGNGPALYVGGQFTLAGGVPARSLAKLKQGVWSEVGGGVGAGGSGYVSCARTLDLGNGPRLFVAGLLYLSGATSLKFVASWDGTAWTHYPFTGYHQFQVIGGRTFTSFEVVRDARNQPLLAMSSADFSSYPGAEVQGGLLVWDGERWFSGGAPSTQNVFALRTVETSGVQKLLVGGYMPGPTALAEWTPAPQCYANCDCSTEAPTLNMADFGCFLQRFAAADQWANCDASTASPVLNVADFTCFLRRFAAGCP